MMTFNLSFFLVVVLVYILDSSLVYSFQIKSLSTLSQRRNTISMSDLENDDGYERKVLTPQRNDLCFTMISGIIGADPKDRYLPNGHFVVNFPIAVTGHFTPIHNWETNKPAETMWLNSEVWDDLAKSNQEYLRKGTYISGIGYLLFNKWIDKATGENKSMIKLRITKLIPKDDLNDILVQNNLSLSSLEFEKINNDDANEMEDVFAKERSMYDKKQEIPKAKSPSANKKTKPQSNFSKDETLPF